MPRSDADAPASDPSPGGPPRRAFTPAIWAWALYDTANTIFSALFVSLVFPLLIVQILHGTKAQVGAASSVAALIGAGIVPFLGTISDRIGRRLPFVLVSTILCCVFVPLAAYLPLGPAIFAGALAMLAYDAGLALYDPILADIAEPAEQGRVSGLGSMLGYGGTLLALACFAPIHFLLGEPIDVARASGWLIGILFFLLAIPLFRKHRETGSGAPLDARDVVSTSVKRVVEGARLASPGLWIFIAASFFYVNAATAIINFFGVYAIEQLELTMGEFLPIYAGMSIAAGVGSHFAGALSDRVGPRRVLMGTGALWIAVLLYLSRDLSYRGFLIGGSFGGIALGSLYTALRPQLIRLADPARVGESFGFLGFAGRASYVVGPFLFGSIADRHGYATAIHVLVGFFAVGLAVFFFLPQSADVHRESATPSGA